MKVLLSLSLLFFTVALSRAEGQSYSAPELAAKLSEAMNNGTAEIRVRMNLQKPDAQGNQALQLRIRQKRSDGSCQAAYEVLWPNERKGETVFVRQAAGGASSGTLRTTDGKTQNLTATDAVLGSDLTVADATENFFAWKNQALAGNEKIGQVDCTILESKPSGSSPYAKVKSWIDLRRMVPLRIEKYATTGKLVRRIETTRVVPDSGRQIPGDLKITNTEKNSQTLLDGSSIKHDVKISDADLSPSQ